MERAAHIGAEFVLLGVPRWQGEMLTREELDRQLELTACDRYLQRVLCASIALGFQDPSRLASEHAVVQHGAFVEALPVKSDDLCATTPVKAWIIV